MLYYDITEMFLKKLMLLRQVYQKKCDICHYWCFLIKVFKFQPDICNDCHDVLITSVNLNIHGTGYRYY